MQFSKIPSELNKSQNIRFQIERIRISQWIHDGNESPQINRPILKVILCHSDAKVYFGSI